MPAKTVYKICRQAEWRSAEAAGVFEGAAIDLADGFIHFSTAAQVTETLALHFAGARDLVLVAADAAVLGDGLKWEPSRGGDLFPHLYTPLPLHAVTGVTPLALADDGRHSLPDLDP